MQGIISQFNIQNKIGQPKSLNIGHINDSFIVPAINKGEKSYFLQKINHHIFTDVDALQRNIEVVTNHIRKKLELSGIKDIDQKVLRLIPTRDGKLYYKTPQGDYWRMYILIENGESQETVSTDSARLAGEAFGNFQTMLSDLPFSDVVESIPNFHNIEFRLQQLNDAIKTDRAKRVKEHQPIINDLLRRADEMCLAERLFREGKLTKRINHCDTKVNNVMFALDGSVLCIVDLDTVMPGFVLSDFGDFMRTAACTAPEDEQNLDLIHVNMDIFEAYAGGYIKTATFLTPLEKSLLPFGCKLLSYMQAVRFFTDYLNGDTYYKIQYPEHNLVRTKAQIRLLEEQEKVYEQMKSIIAKY